MNQMTRRDWMKAATAALAAAAGTSGLLRADEPFATSPSGKGTGSAVAGSAPAGPVVIEGGQVIQPRRELPILRKTQVLVIGGGPAGVSAALSARRLGVDVTLVERYGHFGGLWTGGLVLYVFPMFDRKGKQVVRGMGEEMLKRIEKLDRGAINRKGNPTVDAEAAKYAMVEMVVESGMNVYLHCWACEAILVGGCVRGAVFESKSGRQAILADVVIDTTGDGDVFASAGAGYEKTIYDIGLVSRLGNLDKVDKAKAAEAKAAGAKPPGNLGAATPIPGVTWVNMRGPKADGLDVAELTRIELNSRRAIWKNVERIRQSPGYEQAYLVETAPQLGVRLTRLLEGVSRLTYAEARAGKTFSDAIGCGGVEGSTPVEWQIPYGILVPKTLDGLLTAGRSVSADFKMADILRLIAICYVTGQAAGVAAALSVQDKCPPRKVEIARLQAELKKQDVWIG